MRQILEAISSDTLISFYTDESEPTKFAVGFAATVSEGQVTMAMVDKYGRDDGFRTLSLDEIYLIDVDNDYLRLVTWLRAHPDSHKLPKPKTDYKSDAASLFEREIRIEQENEDVVSCAIGTYGERYWYTGTVLDFDGDVVSIRILDSNGRIDGVSHIRLDNISELSRNDLDDVRLKRFSESHVNT